MRFTNQCSFYIETPEDLDIIYTRTSDKGETFEPNVVIDNANANSRFESQLRPTPDNQTLYAVWNESDGTVTDAVAEVGTTISETVDPELVEDAYTNVLEIFGLSSSGAGSLSLWYLLTLGIFVSASRLVKRR